MEEPRGSLRLAGGSAVIWFQAPFQHCTLAESGADADSGKLDFIDRSVEAAVAAGTVLPLEKGFEKEA
jgi:hypothetical protein